MRILIDADGCPVVRATVACARRHGLEALVVCDSAHHFEIDGAQTVVVPKGADSADFKIANLIQPGYRGHSGLRPGRPVSGTSCPCSRPKRTTLYR